MLRLVKRAANRKKQSNFNPQYKKQETYPNYNKVKGKKMRCPYCGKEHFVPEVVYGHTTAYGAGVKNFRCLHCHRVVKAYCGIRVYIQDCDKTDCDSDW